MEALAEPRTSTGRVTNRLKSWLDMRGYRPLWHLLVVVFIVVASFVLFYRHFSVSGMLMHADMTWPTSLGRISSTFVHTWFQYGGMSNIANAQRVLWIYPFLLPAQVLHLSASQFLLVLYISTFSMAGLSMYALAYQVIGSLHFDNPPRYARFIGAGLAGLIYMYNPWSIGHFWSYFMYPAYALLPLVFLLLVRAFDSPSIKRVLVLSLVMAICSTAPMGVVWLWVLVISYVIFLIVAKRLWRKHSLPVLKTLGQTIGFYALFNAMWLVPYFGAVIINKTLVPTYASPVSKGMIDTFSANNSIANNLRLVAGWGFPVDPNPTNSLLIILSFVVPILAIACLLAVRQRIKNNRVVNYWSLIFVLSILLATGSSFILKQPYRYLVLKGPGASSMGWIFRGPDRWLAFVPMFYALMLGILLTALLSVIPSRARSVGRWFDIDAIRSALKPTKTPTAGSLNDPLVAQVARLQERIDRFDSVVNAIRYYGTRVLALLMVVAVLLSFYPLTLAYAQKVMDPTRLPSDYEKVNRFLMEKGGKSQVVWLPFFGGGHAYAWANGKRLGPFEVFSSNPSLNDFLVLTDSYAYFLEFELYGSPSFMDVALMNREDALRTNLGSKLFAPYSAKYIVLDKSIPGNDFGKYLDGDTSLKPVMETNLLKVYEIPDSTSAVWPATKTVRYDSFFDILSIARKVPTGGLKGVTFVDQKARLPKSLKTYNIDDYKQVKDANWHFEDVSPDGAVPFWAKQQDNSSNFTVAFSKDKPSWAAGRRSLRIDNRSSDAYAFGGVIGAEFPVAPGDIYSVESSLKYHNVTWTHVVVEGYKEAEDKWVQLMQCPSVVSGDSDWRKWNASFMVPFGISKIRPKLVAGWVDDRSKGPATSWFDDIKISRIDNKLFTDLMAPVQSPQVKSVKLGPEKYRVGVKNAASSFMLVLGQAFDQLWVANTSTGKKVDSGRTYSTINGFPITVKGQRNFTVTVEYIAQNWFVWGLVISLVAVLLCLLYLLIEWMRHREFNGIVFEKSKQVSFRAGKAVRSYLEMPPRKWKQ